MWNISKEIYGTGTNWHSLYNVNQHIFDSSLIYPGMKLEIHRLPENADERFMTETRKKINSQWLIPSYIHYYHETTERSGEYPKETEVGLPEDIWYFAATDNGRRWLVIENQERGKSQEFYRFTIDSDTGEISGCEQFHGAGGRLYLTEETSMRIWVMTKEINGEVIGIAGEYRGSTYIGGNFYYEKQKDGTVKEAYQLYINGGIGKYDPSGGTYEYPY